MSSYLNFVDTNCKNCYKCLRECPVKAITVIGDEAKINADLCVLCGHCTSVCHFNAKVVSDSRCDARKLLSGKSPVIASVAPAFVSSFKTDSFADFKAALLKLGFSDAYETAEGANIVTKEYKKLLASKEYKNLIASACPAIVRLMQLYYPDSLKYLAPTDSPMLAHAKMIRERLGDCKVVFIGPCIAKKREADMSKLVDCALTFEELEDMLAEDNIKIEKSEEDREEELSSNKARYYPINRGIIKSFDGYVEGYEFISVDGLARASEVLSNIDTLSGMFIEMHACEFSCINGPCALGKDKGGFIKATEEVRAYTKRSNEKGGAQQASALSFSREYLPIKVPKKMPTEEEIRAILTETGKTSAEDELNCGACGYNTCRDKAIAVYNGWAQVEMCVPFMREKAESMSYEIIQNSPNGIIAVDEQFNISEINLKARQLLGIEKSAVKGDPLEYYYNPAEFYRASTLGEEVTRKKMQLKSGAWVEMTITRVHNQKTTFCIMKDITGDIFYEDKIKQLKEDTLKTTNEVVEKQMRVVQEIASLLGETAAETKIALIKLKDTIQK